MQLLRSTAVRRWAVAGTAALGLAGAGGGAASAATWGPPGPGHMGPGAFGTVASLGASSFQVQNAQSGQMTVNWSATTTFRQLATVPAGSVAVNDCVAVTGTVTNGTLSARSVTVTPAPADASCTNPGHGSSLAPGRFPRGGPDGRFPPLSSPDHTPPSGSVPPPDGAPDVGIAFGKVTAVTSSTLTIDGFSSADRPKPNGANGSGAAPSPPAATNVEVQLSSTTTYRKIATAAASNLAVGDCVAALGSRGSDGSVTASDITITSGGASSCAAGFGGAFGPGTRRGGPHPV